VRRQSGITARDQRNRRKETMGPTLRGTDCKAFQPIQS
jgi:hypothetical protein